MSGTNDSFTKAGFTKPTAPEWAEHSRSGDVSTGRAFKAVQEVPLTTRIYSDSSYTYICEAKPGTAVSSSLWRVSRVDSSGNELFADGNDQFDNAATDLSTVQGLSYS